MSVRLTRLIATMGLFATAVWVFHPRELFTTPALRVSQTGRAGALEMLNKVPEHDWGIDRYGDLVATQRDSGLPADVLGILGLTAAGALLYWLSLRPSDPKTPSHVYTTTGLMLSSSGPAIAANIWRPQKEPSEDPGVHCYLADDGWMCADNADLMRECNAEMCTDVDLDDSY